MTVRPGSKLSIVQRVSTSCRATIPMMLATMGIAGCTTGDLDTAGHIVEGESPVPGLLTIHGNVALHIGEGHGLRVAQDGDHEAVGAGNGDGDIAVVPVHDLLGLVVDVGVDGGDLLQGKSSHAL